jgi:hypothetical protein
LYLSSVPSDHSDVAEAYYSIAWLLGYHDTNDKKQISALEKTVSDMGQNAESALDPLKFTKPWCIGKNVSLLP